ncbi:class F sortase [Calidifontibacter sp. DB0510]|uniref:Class F sortase n=1 Tax=Metallococcus carri TaxID=1656884 RepID=A0A967B3M9_9MICO|nr:class F sortase [Metallococcus carri]NHN56938.1 class F sortase [Metallococcus carri]NOP37683.1 class F sortase [Calidifontibacter sp. DB2511S]
MRAGKGGTPVQIAVTRGGRSLVSATVIPVQAPNGVLNPPKGVVGWYAAPGWPTPGTTSTNNSVLAGHVSWGDQPDTFAALASVRPGDLVTVTDASGGATQFTVSRGPVSIGKTQIAAQQNRWIWQSANPGKVLSLITCDSTSGRRADGHLRGNVVVQARA